MDLGLKGKTAIVTGGASNIGRGICTTFGGEGANVTIVDIDQENGTKVAQMVRDQGGKAKFIKASVTVYSEAERVVKETLEEFGSLDVLVNNVGWEDFYPFMQIPPEKYDKYLDLNLKHVFYFVRAVLPHMIEKKAGSIVSIASDAGRVGEFRETIYSAGKGGVISFNKSIAKEVARYGIRCNCICPGATLPSEEEAGSDSMHRQKEIKTLFTPEAMERAKSLYPLRRLGKAQDIANMVAFVASDRCSWVTGQTISVSGGFSMI